MHLLCIWTSTHLGIGSGILMHPLGRRSSAEVTLYEGRPLAAKTCRVWMGLPQMGPPLGVPKLASYLLDIAWKHVILCVC